MQVTFSPPVRVFIAAAPLIRWGLQRLIETAAPRFEVAGAGAWCPGGTITAEMQQAHVVLIALEPADPKALAVLCSQVSGNALLVTEGEPSDWIDEAVLAGVRGVVRTSEPPQALLKAIERVSAGEMWIDRAATSRIFVKMARRTAGEVADPVRSRISTLTSRERQAIVAVVSDVAAPGKVIAHRLSISEHTLRNHLTSIYSKLGVCNRVDLYAFATRHALHAEAQ